MKTPLCGLAIEWFKGVKSLVVGSWNAERERKRSALRGGGGRLVLIEDEPV